MYPDGATATGEEQSGRLLRTLRESRGWTQERLADASGVSVRTIGNLENERVGRPRQSSVLALCRALQVPRAEADRIVREISRRRRPVPALPERPWTAAYGGPAPHDPAGLAPPVHGTELVGRYDELRRLGRALEQHRVATLTGPPGIGKSRLAAEYARRAPGPVWFVDLAQEDSRGTLATLGAALRDPAVRTPALLVLDNADDALDAACRLAGFLLRSGGGATRLLTTGREPLGLALEAGWPIGPLPVPREPTRRGVLASPAGRLFVQRAAEAAPFWRLSEANCAAVAHLCAVLEGHPLALELAAGQLSAISLEDILSRMSHQLDLLERRRAPQQGRHQSLRQAFERSWIRLRPIEQRVLAAVSVFQGDFSLEAAEHLVGGDRGAGQVPGRGGGRGADGGAPPANALDTARALRDLVTQSLISVHRYGDRLRYRLIGPVRAFAAERSAETGDRTGLRRRHAQYFCRLAERHARLAASGERVRLLPCDEDNVRAAAQHARALGDLVLWTRIMQSRLCLPEGLREAAPAGPAPLRRPVGPAFPAF
ncbi:helix-turn-helix domain-containing protein [Kitasatospora sp. NPDC056327]|uniref:ATP-binding protein n=1 Tax=Kitasatospora sp. NPDC056327 TaxID=3345785 RepID=UPI0035D81509